MKSYSRVCAHIDLDAILRNIGQLKQKTGPDTKLMAVIKMDGYGHGALPLARMFEGMDDIWGYAVATADEGILLRGHGIEKPILVLGCVFPDQYGDAIRHGLRMNIYTRRMAEEISVCAGLMGTKAYGHIKLDTGMGRLGFSADEEGIREVLAAGRESHLELEGIFTHFARADEADLASAREQLGKFTRAVAELKKQGMEFRYRHCANSAGITVSLGTDLELVRAGISMYGLYPSGETGEEKLKLYPALSLTSTLSLVKWVPEGTPVSYGGTFVAPKTMRIATIPVGYGDGYPRSLSGRGYVLLHGKKAPILGRVCMDQFMVDVTDIPEADFGSRAVLAGSDGDESISVEALGELSGRFNYEFVCALGKRIPREYIKGGKVVEQVDYFS